MEAFAKPEFHFDLTQGSPPNDQVGELTKRVQALEKKLEANTKTLEANTRQLAESTHQVSKLAALLQFFHKGKKKKVAVDVAFPVSSDEDLLDLDLKISLGSKGDYIQAITTLLERNNLPKAIQSVLTEQLLCEYNIDGVNGKKALKTFPEFFSVLIDSISSLEDQQPAEKALAHALSCVRNNANKKNYKK
ncbi:uncharacterized protein LOC108135474 [Drosophila elegans]|uniref:uncharacterized protein LOC108135474 n=1 Tax=Drosophila elegans TaxID=30023 RepID=UPI001BC85E03|nr:uncharacterized protein LOC108135474 [Drosophila elegans]